MKGSRGREVKEQTMKIEALSQVEERIRTEWLEGVLLCTFSKHNMNAAASAVVQNKYSPLSVFLHAPAVIALHLSVLNQPFHSLSPRRHTILRRLF